MSINKLRTKIKSRLRTKARQRKRMNATDSRPRLSVFRSSKYTYAQLVSDESSKTIMSASTRDGDVMSAIAEIKAEGIASQAKSPKSVIAAKALGAVIAKRCKDKEINSIIFDRNGFLYHGRIKAVAEGAREGGLEF